MSSILLIEDDAWSGEAARPTQAGIETIQARRGDCNDSPTRLQPVIIPASSKEDEYLVPDCALWANRCVCKAVDLSGFCEIIRQPGLSWRLFNDTPAPVKI